MGSTGQPERPIVTIPQGIFRGKVLESNNHPVSIEAWLGIRYAQPPLGDLRFARPVPLPPSTDTFDAVEFGYKCPAKQLIKMPGMPESSEDCLTLNVFRQTGSTGDGKAKLPVMVYLHGGAFNRGTAAMHDTASMLSHSTKPILAISFNYRIGALGFLNCEMTAKEGLLNLGLHDQRLVLEWVQENAAAFGGDPSNVTLVGLSAGAHSIAHHMMNINETRELFHKAIIESGGHTSRVVHPYDSKLHARQFEEFLAAAGVPTDLPEPEILQFLRQLPEDAIVKAEIKVFDQYNPSVRWAWQPVIDDEIISRRPLDAWNSGKWHKMPIMTGFNHNEGSMYVPKNLSDSPDFRNFFATLLPQLSSDDLDRLEILYPDPTKNPESPYLETRDEKYGLGAQFKRLEAAYGHYAYVAPVRQTAHLATTIDPAHPPTYLYHWTANSSIINGANHGDQMWYECMDPKVRAVSPRHERLARMFNEYVCNFVTTGDPNGVEGKMVERPVWKGYGDDGETMVFGEGNDERAGGESEGVEAQLVRYGWAEEETRFWWGVGGKYED
ncbi:alpha/beta-hydrolase [Teratosphaeria nubilosa]|uniref:Carboxylic ester hydrolase n=1 Tax=Teratosphaeria nubilosa TaxID=161662 RepID=A0A6G1KYN2_9PEZI|nr:alpha/beta-hydrolase [Teratosphaeria nubilosa]